MDDKRTQNIITFVMLAFLCTILEVTGEWMDHYLGYTFAVEPIALVSIIAVLFGIVRLTNHRHILNMSAAKKVTLLATIPIGLSALAFLPLSKGNLEIKQTIIIFISVFLSAVAEELYFRGIGIHLLHSDDGKICFKDTCWLIGVFGVMHFLPMVLVPDLWLEELLYSLVAMALAYFLLGAYMAADSSILPTVIHMLVLFPQRLTHVIDHDSFYVKYGIIIINILMAAFCIVAGRHLLRHSNKYDAKPTKQ